jgi:hypothetical protein
MHLVSVSPHGLLARATHFQKFMVLVHIFTGVRRVFAATEFTNSKHFT